jgi:hypothetical protein
MPSFCLCFYPTLRNLSISGKISKISQIHPNRAKSRTPKPPPKTHKAEWRFPSPKTQKTKPTHPNESYVTHKLSFFSPGFSPRLRRHFRLKSRSQIADSKSRKAEWQFSAKNPKRYAPKTQNALYICTISFFSPINLFSRISTHHP